MQAQISLEKQPGTLLRWRRKWQPTPVFLPRESRGQRRLMGCSLQCCKKSDTIEATQHACMHWRRKWQPTPIFLPGEYRGQRRLMGCSLQCCKKSDTIETTQHACMHWRRKWQPTPIFLPGESLGQRSLVGCRPWGGTKLDMTEVTQQQQQRSCLEVFQQPYQVNRKLTSWQVQGTQNILGRREKSTQACRYFWQNLVASSC